MDGMSPADPAPPGIGNTRVFAHKGWRAARKATLLALAQPGWVVLTGPAGIGKSLLLSRLPHLLEPRPVRWLDPDQRPLPHNVDDGAVWLLDHADRLNDGLLAMLARNGLNLVMAAPANASARLAARAPARVVTIGRVPPEEVAEYAKTRLLQLGRGSTIFGEAALTRLQEAGGVPRALNARIDDELAAAAPRPGTGEETESKAPADALTAASSPIRHQASDEEPVQIVSPSPAPSEPAEPALPMAAVAVEALRPLVEHSAAESPPAEAPMEATPPAQHPPLDEAPAQIVSALAAQEETAEPEPPMAAAEAAELRPLSDHPAAESPPAEAPIEAGPPIHHQAPAKGPGQIVSADTAPDDTAEPEPSVAVAPVTALGPPENPPTAESPPVEDHAPVGFAHEAVEPGLPPALPPDASPPLASTTRDEPPALSSVDPPTPRPAAKPILAASGFPITSVKSRQHYRDLGVGLAVGALILLSLAAFLIGLRRHEASRVVTLDFSAKHPATIALTAPPRPLPTPAPATVPARPALEGIDARTIAARYLPMPTALAAVPGQRWLPSVSVVPQAPTAGASIAAATKAVAPMAAPPRAVAPMAAVSMASVPMAATAPAMPQVALPAAVPVTVLLRYSVRSSAAQREAQTTATTLRAQGYTVQSLPQNAATSRRQVGFFYQEDQATAVRIAASIADRSPPRALPILKREPVAPGTIEISLPP